MGSEQQVKIREGIVDELAHRLTKLQGRIAGIVVNEFTDQFPLGRNRISGNVLVDEIADQLALGSDRITGDRVDEFTDEVTGCNWVTWNIDLMDKAADELLLGGNRLARYLNRVNEIPYKMTKILHLETLSDLRHCHRNRLSGPTLKRACEDFRDGGHLRSPQRWYESGRWTSAIDINGTIWCDMKAYKMQQQCKLL